MPQPMDRAGRTRPREPAVMPFSGGAAPLHAEAGKLFEGTVLWLTDADSLCTFAPFCDPTGVALTQVVRTHDPGARD
jgi:hypothetical protein